VANLDVASLYAASATVPTITTAALTSAGDAISLSGKGLSNVANLDVASLSAGASGGVINAQQTSLSNLSALYATTATVPSITTAELTSAGDAVSLSGKGLSNVANLDVASLSAGASGGIIDAQQTSLSNLSALYAASATVPTITTAALTSAGDAISLSGKGLSNVANLDVASLSAGASGGVIDAQQTSLSNLSALYAASATVATITTAALTTAGDAISLSGKGLSNVGNVELTSFSQATQQTSIDGMQSTLSNLAAVSAMTVTTTTLTSSAASIAVPPAMRIQGYDASLYAGALGATFGSSSCNAFVGLRVDYNVLSQAYLSFSDRRLKTCITQSDPATDLAVLLAVPVVSFRFKDAMLDRGDTLGFIAQDVEAVAPFAVRSVAGPVPSILRDIATTPSDSTLYLTNHGLRAGDELRFTVNSEEAHGTVAAVLDGDRFILSQPLPAGRAFLYGHYVPDIKLIDHDRLLPVAFNAVKAMHAEVGVLCDLVAALTARVVALETRT
jgi:hypothetical protein